MGRPERNKEEPMKEEKIMNKQGVNLPIAAAVHDAAMKMRESGVGSLLHPLPIPLFPV